jgi:hypothetical protein
MDKLDVSLDDLVSQHHHPKRRTGPIRTRNQTQRRKPYDRQQASGGKLIVSNIDYKLPYQNLHELFSQLGQVRKLQMNHDEHGKFMGNVHVVYATVEETNQAATVLSETTLNCACVCCG